MGTVKPDWMSEDMEIALWAVQDETDPSVLARIASEAELAMVRSVATQKILMPKIRQSEKGQKFIAFFEANRDLIFEVAWVTRVTWSTAPLLVYHLEYKGTPFYVPDLQKERWVINPSIGHGDINSAKLSFLNSRLTQSHFFQIESDERFWTPDESGAIQRLIHDFMGQQSQFFLPQPSICLYRRTPPAEAVRAKRPY